MSEENVDGVGIGKGELVLPHAIKRELYNHPPKEGSAPKKAKTEEAENDWVDAGRMGFFVEIPKRDNSSADSLAKDMRQLAGKQLKMYPYDESCNAFAVRVKVPGRRCTTIWKYGGDQFLSRFLSNGRRGMTRCEAVIRPGKEMEVLDDPKRKTFRLVSVDVHFSLHKDIDLLTSGMDTNVKRQVKQLIGYLRGGTQPNPGSCIWPTMRKEDEDDCLQRADRLERLLKKRTAKNWWLPE